MHHIAEEVNGDIMGFLDLILFLLSLREWDVDMLL